MGEDGMSAPCSKYDDLNSIDLKCNKNIGDDSNRRIIGPLFPSKILTSYSFLRELKQLPRALRGNKKAKAKSRRENQS